VAARALNPHFLGTAESQHHQFMVSHQLTCSNLLFDSFLLVPSALAVERVGNTGLLDQSLCQWCRWERYNLSLSVVSLKTRPLFQHQGG